LKYHYRIIFSRSRRGAQMNTITLEAHVDKQRQRYNDIPYDLSNVLADIVIASKIIREKVITAGICDILGEAGTENVHGEDVKKLDIFANDTLKNILSAHQRFSLIASEEEPDVVKIKSEKGSYVILFDPLDGSSNIDVNISVGTIFSIYKQCEPTGPSKKDCLKPGAEQVAAGYILYGTSVMLVYSAGHGVHSFTYHPSIGEFILTEEDIRIPEKAKYYSINEGNSSQFLPGTVQFLDQIKKENPLSARYVGSLVTDFHRNLLKGGVFIYPVTAKSPKGKLRLLYEANPLAFICEQAGGAATDGYQRILEIKPEELHQRVGLIIGNKDLVEKATALSTKI